MNDPAINPIIHTTEFREYLQSPPSLDEALSFLRRKYGETLDESFVREWYEDMEGHCWCDLQGHTIRNWPGIFYRWRKNRARFAALRAVPEQPRNGRTPPRADNYIRASEETIRKFREGFI